jgi:hypothetical protein
MAFRYYRKMRTRSCSKFKGSESIGSAPDGPFRASSGRGITQG